ncbi:hypothetical protein [Enterococcus cecorum]|uniref:hypothetical protein n=1 Tax=Enterococcus cecorum TaxID=44008 RepID=UPI0032C4ADA6
MDEPRLYEGKPCRVYEMQVGTTLFTVISVQSDSAKETVNDKVKNLILNNRKNTTKLSVGYSQ